MPKIELRPIRETTSDYDRLEKEILDLFKKHFFYPLLKEVGVPKNTIQNALEDLVEAIKRGKIEFKRGLFTGKFSSVTSKELKILGATWDKKSSGFRLPAAELPADVKMAIGASEARFEQTIKKLDSRLKEMSPEAIADKFQAEKIFDSTLWKVDQEFKKTVKGITVPPDLTAARRATIAKEYTNNLKLYIKDFTEKEIVRLRKQVQKTAFSGLRMESLHKDLQESYGVTANKAKFLARQETSLLMTKFKQDRYEDAGVREYKWACVAGSKNHPVRPWHKALEGKTFRWDSPPVTTKPGEPVRRNNPGQDYNCRCFAIPIVRF